MPSLKRNVGVFGAASIGIANIIGAGIFVISGVAAGLAGPAVIISFFLAGIIALLTALSSAELSSFITETGASYAYTKKAFGSFWGFFVGWFKYFDYIVGAAAVSVGFAAYFSEVFGLSGALPLILAAVLLPVLFTILNIIGVEETAKATSGMVFLKIFALVLLLMLGGFYLAHNFDPTKYTPFFPNGFGGALNGAAIIFFAFLGFNTVTMMSEETKNPEKTIPQALLLAFVVSFILYLGIGTLEVGVVSWKLLGVSAAPLADVAAVISSNRIFLDFISFSALVATGSVVLSSITGGSRAGFAMSRDGLLPSQLAAISNKYGTPYTSIIVSGGIAAALAGIFYNNINTIASIVNFGSLFTYSFVHLSLIKLRSSDKKSERKFKVPFYPLVPILGLVSCIMLMFFLSSTAMLASAIWGALGLCVFGFFVVLKTENGQKKSKKALNPNSS